MSWPAGLRFEATDLDWTCGSGPVVRGTGEALALGLTGRSVVLAELAGDGVREASVPDGGLTVHRSRGCGFAAVNGRTRR